jgi:hypothetical protein
MNEIDQRVMQYQQQGWVLVGQVGNVIQLRKPKKFSVPLEIVLVFTGIGWAIYPLWYALITKDQFMTLTTGGQTSMGGQVNGQASEVQTGQITETRTGNKKQPKWVIWVIIALVVLVIILCIVSNQSSGSAPVPLSAILLFV